MSHIAALAQNPMVAGNPQYVESMKELERLANDQANGEEAETVVVQDLNQYPVLQALSAVGAIAIDTNQAPEGGYRISVVGGEEEEGEHMEHLKRDKSLASEDTTFAEEKKE